MSTQNEGGYKTFTSGEALLPYTRVKVNSSGQVIYADKGENSIGVVQEEALASGVNVVVRLWNAGGTFSILTNAASAGAVGSAYYAADDGKVSLASTGALGTLGYGLEAPGADEAVIELAPYKSNA